MSADVDSPVRVTVTPSQSCYFAGESFSVTITFANTRNSETVPVRSAPHSHKRGAHSISSAPLARPPTSPGTPTTPVSAFATRSRIADDTPVRKGLLGRDTAVVDQLPDLIEQRRKRLLAKSLSLNIVPQELEDTLGEGGISKSASYMQPNFSFHGARATPSSPKMPSPLSRSHTLALSSNHPHARKQSLLDGQAQINDVKPPSSPSLYTPSSSTTSFTLALDPISEASPDPYPPTPSMSSPSIVTPSNPIFPPTNHKPNPANGDVVHAYPPTRHGRRHSQIGLGQPSNSFGLPHNSPRTAFSSTFPQSNAEIILYSYAQLTGTVTLTPLAGTPSTAEQSFTLNALRSTLLNKKAVVGGGSMDISSSLQPQSASPRRKTHSRSSSFSSGLLSLLSPTTFVTSVSTPPASSGSWVSGRQRTVSASPSPGSPSFPTPSFGNFEQVDPDTPLPTFQVQPAMLAVDLTLLPGESRTYTYSVPIPDNLPPTFRGKTLKFSYELVVGTCRAGTGSGHSSSGPVGANSVSRIMKVPIRLYNNVVVGRSPSPYDLLWPATRQKLSLTDGPGKVVEESAKLLTLKRFGSLKSQADGTLGDLKNYAKMLIESFPEPNTSGVRLKLPAEGVEHAFEHERWMKEDRRQEMGGLSGCREAVDILTRNPKKASYDVNKDGVKVAVLTFTKSAYRLGETILGVVELNERKGLSRVLQLSVMLETVETIPSALSGASNSRHLRRVHAEHHSSFVLSTLRTTFSLDIPSDATPAFQIKVGTDTTSPKPGGLEWKVRLCLLVAVVPESSEAGSEGVRMKSLLRDGIRGEWGSSWRATASIAPLDKPVRGRLDAPQSPTSSRSWTSFITSSFLGGSEREYHDGDEADDEEDEEGVYDGIKADLDGGVGTGVNFGGGEAGWKETKVETVECEVPIKVWPGNTVFKPVDVVFDV